MTDLMVGMLFIFIIMLMAFALNYRQATKTQEEINTKRDQINANLTGARQTRDQILKRLRELLERQGVKIEIDPENGVLRLKADLLFDTGKSDLTAEGRIMIDKVGAALFSVLPCYAFASQALHSAECSSNRRGGHLEAVFIEGHTDSDPYRPGAARDNWVLSAERAIKTYKRLTEAEPGLDSLRNSAGHYLLGVSGYEARRPTPRTPQQSAEAAKAADRRIDLRFIMASPKPEPVVRTEQHLGR